MHFHNTDNDTQIKEALLSKDDNSDNNYAVQSDKEIDIEINNKNNDKKSLLPKPNEDKQSGINTIDQSEEVKRYAMHPQISKTNIHSTNKWQPFLINPTNTQ